MGFTETAEQVWSKMSIAMRVTFLEELAQALHRHPTWWGGFTIESIAQIPSFDDLPRDLQGRLILAVTKDRFSVAEQARAQEESGTINRSSCEMNQ